MKANKEPGHKRQETGKVDQITKIRISKKTKEINKVMMHKNPQTSSEQAMNTSYPLQGWKLKKKLFALIKLSYTISTNTTAQTITIINLVFVPTIWLWLHQSSPTIELYALQHQTIQGGYSKVIFHFQNQEELPEGIQRRGETRELL